MQRGLLLLYFIVLHSAHLIAQNITIVSSGGEAAGTNWTFSGNTITATGDVSIDSSVINAHLSGANNLTITTAGNIVVNTLIGRTVANLGNDSLVLESTAGSIYLGANITCPMSNQYGYMAITLSAANIYLTANCTLQSNAGTINIGTSPGTGNLNGNYDFKVDSHCDNNPTIPLRRLTGPVNFNGSAGVITPLKTIFLDVSLSLGNPLLVLSGGTYKTTSTQTYKVGGLMSGNTLLGGIVLGQPVSIITNGGNVIFGAGDAIVTSKSNGNNSLSINTTNLNTTSPYNDGYVLFKCEKFIAPTNYNYVGDITITTYDGTGTPGDFYTYPTNINTTINMVGNFTFLGRHFSLGQNLPLGTANARYITINTNPTNTGNSGSVNLYNSATQSAIVGAGYFGLIKISTKTNSGTAGDITIGRIAGATTLAGTIDSCANQANLDAVGSTASGTIKLFGNIRVDNQASVGQLNTHNYSERGLSILGGQVQLMNADMSLKVTNLGYPSGPMYLKGQFVSGHASNVTNLITHSATDSLYTGTVINTGGDITIWATKFINRAGSGALVVPNGKRWRIWSYNTSPFSGGSSDIRGNLLFDYKQYNALYDTTVVKGIGNGVLYKYAPALTVSLVGAVTKTYDGNTTATLDSSNYSIAGSVDNDTSVVTSSSASYASSAVGSNISVTASGLSISNTRTSNMPVYDYSLSNSNATANIGEITQAFASYPVPNQSSVKILCGFTSVNLNTITDNNVEATTVPLGAILTWHTSSTATTQNLVADATQVGEGDYYAAYYFSGTSTYSVTNTTPVVVSKEPCLELQNVCPASSVNLNNLDQSQSTLLSNYISTQIGAYSTGSSLTYHTAAVASDGNKIADVTSLGAGVYHASYSTGSGNYSATAPINVTIQTFNNKTTYYQDNDGDGFGNGAISLEACSQPAGYVSNQTDCDDTNASINPDATEICDEVDNDCDGQIDEGVTTTYYLDSDGDGYGDASNSTQSCTQPPGYVSDNTDFNDASSAAYPGATEICDSVDNDGDGFIDNGVGNIYYLDSDGDGYGDASNSTQSCTQPTGYVSNSTDCDPANGAKWRSVLLYIDVDGDGYTNGSSLVCYGATVPTGYKLTTLGVDCNDNNAAVHPGATEICGNGIDDNCNGQIDEGCAVVCNFKTKSQSGWSSSSKTNPLTTAWFNSKFPSGLFIGGIGTTSRRIRFTTASAVKAFLPNIGTAAVLTKDLLNPTKTSLKNEFAGELVALKLNSALNVGLATAVISSGAYKGMTVSQFISECDKQISSVASKSSSLSALMAVCAKINGGYEDCNTGILTCTPPVLTLLGNGNSFLQQTVQLESTSILIYPNPSYSQFVIKNENKLPLEVRLLNVNGQLLENRGKLEPDASMYIGADLIPGIYILELKGEGVKLFKKLIKQ